MAGARRIRGKKRFQNHFSVLRGAVKHRSSVGVPLLEELTPSAERPSLSLALEPVVTHAPTDLAEMVLAPLSGSAVDLLEKARAAYAQYEYARTLAWIMGPGQYLLS